MHTDEFVVRPRHIDILGHLNYLELLGIAEEARLLFVEERSAGREMLLAEDRALLVRDAEAKYKLEVFEGEKLQVSIDVRPKGRLHLEFSLIVRRGPLPVATVTLTMVLVRMSDKQKSALEIPPDLLEALTRPSPAATPL